MKTLYKFFIGILLIAACTSAQAQYYFSTFNAPYQALSNPLNLSLNDPTWDDVDFNIAIGFPVSAFGSAYDSMTVESNGTVLLYNYLTANEIWATADTFPAFNAFGEYLTGNSNGDLRYRSSGTSPINYELSGVVGSRIAKIEWKNSGFYNDGPNYMDSINFQVWIYETSGDVEYRYGAGSVSSASYNGETGPTVGISKYEADPTYDYISGTYLTGATTNPTVGITYNQLTGTPANGTVYRFATSLGAGITTVANNSSLLSVYPNPASNVVTLNFTPTGLAIFSLSDITGRVIHNEEIKANGAVNKRFNVSKLPSGVYYVTIKDEVSVSIKKLTVK